MQEKNKLLSPTKDIVFQCLFGKPENERITRDLISKVLGRELSELDLDKNAKLIPKYPDKKYGIVDVIATEKATGIKFDVEMQTSSPKSLPSRLLYYWSKIYGSQLIKGNDYDKLRPAILIVFLKENMGILKEIKEFHTEWRIIEKKDRKVILTDQLEIHIIEIKKYLSETQANEKDELRYWIEFLNNPDEGGGNMDKEKYEKVKQVRKAKEELEKLSADPEVRRMVELEERWKLDYNSDINEARRDGVEIGRQEKQKEIAKNMLKENATIEFIEKVTGLTKEEIEKIK